MPHEPYKALYLHLPFCASRCGYCDFATSARDRNDPAIDAYIDHLCTEIAHWHNLGELNNLESVYVGGGTPTHIGCARLTHLFGAIADSVNFAHFDFEYTLEANPESFDKEMVRTAAAYGVNRISLGVQSFDDDILRFLGRAHDANTARTAVFDALEQIENVSVDLMCGISGQTLQSFIGSVRIAVELGVSHVSIYPLTIEKGTPFSRLVERGLMEEPDPDVQADQMDAARILLEDAGFLHYEVASYAKPEKHSWHNCAYWSGVPYLGIGDAATTMTQNAMHRMRVCNGVVVDDLDKYQMAAEDLMLGMRMACGIADKRIEAVEHLLPDVRKVLTDLKEQNFVSFEDGFWKPTHRGWLCGNELYGRLLDLAP